MSRLGRILHAICCILAIANAVGAKTKKVSNSRTNLANLSSGPLQKVTIQTSKSEHMRTMHRIAIVLDRNHNGRGIISCKLKCKQ